MARVSSEREETPMSDHDWLTESQLKRSNHTFPDPMAGHVSMTAVSSAEMSMSTEVA
jgi:hypothetical protein